MSNGVKRIKAFLSEHNLKFEQEFRFKECRSKLPLPFDFVIFDKDKLVAAIEYNGVQHYKGVRRFGGKKALTKQQQHDLIKSEFCRANKIPFLVVSYEQDNIEELCEEFLHRISL